MSISIDLFALDSYFKYGFENLFQKYEISVWIGRDSLNVLSEYR